jgi:PTH2 family peptidyl-tRNA hydrolase
MSDPYKTKQVIVMRKDLNMNRGKEIAQGAHASMAWLSNRIRTSKRENGRYLVELSEAERVWLEGQFAKVTCQVDSAAELEDLVAAGKRLYIGAELIVDSGKTYFKGVSTPTCCAIGPGTSDLIDRITGKLKLY